MLLENEQAKQSGGKSDFRLGVVISRVLSWTWPWPSHVVAAAADTSAMLVLFFKLLRSGLGAAAAGAVGFLVCLCSAVAERRLWPSTTG